MTRLLLDAHLSGRAIERALRARGHDIRAIDAEKDLEGLRDQGVLELAISEDRVLITANVADFLPLLTALIESGRSHPRPTHRVRDRWLSRGWRQTPVRVILPGLGNVVAALAREGGTGKPGGSERTACVAR